jgi:hypothetical protein
MILSNLQQQFVVYFGKNFFYPEVVDRWLPAVKRLCLPYMNLEDFMLAQLQSFSFPAINMSSVNQQWGQYKLSKRDSRTLDQAMDKTMTFTFKLTEGYISYFIWRQQMDLYYQEFEIKKLYMNPIMVDLLDDQGHAVITYEQEQITPISLSDLPLSYAAKLGSYSTFTLTTNYNYYDVWYYDTVSKKMIKQERQS